VRTLCNGNKHTNLITVGSAHTRIYLCAEEMIFLGAAFNPVSLYLFNQIEVVPSNKLSCGKCQVTQFDPACAIDLISLIPRLFVRLQDETCIESLFR
jgi:hypothetical protein